MSSDSDLYNDIESRDVPDENLPGWYLSVRETYFRLFWRLLGRYYDPKGVRWISVVAMFGLIGILGLVQRVDGSLELLAAVAALELSVILILIRRERKWRSGSGAVSVTRGEGRAPDRDLDRGEINLAEIVLGVLLLLLIISIGPETALSELEEIVSDLLVGFL